MVDEWTRRRLLGVTGAVAGTGCLETSDATESEGEEAADETDDSGSEATGADDGGSTDEEPAIHEGYETTEVRAVTPAGDELGSVTAAIADTSDRRWIGLSETEELPDDRGMLFVYESVADRTFVMREMDFGIDIVYADADGTITEIHHAPAPGPDEDGEEQRYPGRGQYVLEVTYEWTSDRGVSEGDVLEFALDE